MVQSHKSNTRRCCGSAATSTSNARLWRRQAAQRSAEQRRGDRPAPAPAASQSGNSWLSPSQRHVSRPAASLFFLSWKSRAESHSERRGASQSAANRRRLLSSSPQLITFSYCGNKGHQSYPLFLYLDEQDPYPLTGLQSRRSSRVPASTLSSGIHGAGTGPRLAHSFPSSSSLFCTHNINPLSPSCHQLPVPRRSSERNQSMDSRDNPSHRDGTGRKAPRHLEELLQAETEAAWRNRRAKAVAEWCAESQAAGHQDGDLAH